MFGLPLIALTSGCEEPSLRTRSIITLSDRACQDTPECKALAEACAGNEACLGALNTEVEDQREGHEGEITSIPTRVVTRYGDLPDEPITRP